MKVEEDDFLELRSMQFEHNYKTLKCQVMDYIDAKTKDLQEFGYKSLDEKQVKASLLRVLNNEAKGEDIIDQFIKGDKPELIT